MPTDPEEGASSQGQSPEPEPDEPQEPSEEAEATQPQEIRPYILNWGPTADPTIEKYDPGEDREKTRGRLAGGLAVLLGVVAVSLIGLTAFNKLTLDEAKDLGAVIFGPIVVLTGTALGFYFGVHQNGR